MRGRSLGMVHPSRSCSFHPERRITPFFSLHPNPHILHPTYTVHSTQPIPTERLITPYTSLITPSSQYLADPLSTYAHLGMPKPYVHLVGWPLAVTLDVRRQKDSCECWWRGGWEPHFSSIIFVMDFAQSSLICSLHPLPSSSLFIRCVELSNGVAHRGRY
ncbi:hypothetical protein CPC08DRAFT_120465 [Agrocybe pediades]|nr:hypothetical protein CPC08DRAFT_120465 [Agrocybe pediades]